MTTPKVNTIKRGDARFYVEPESGVKYPGVTSVLNTLPKPFLKFWAAKMVAEEAVDNFGALATILTSGSSTSREMAVDMLKRAPDRNTKAAADIGTAAHDIFERMAKGETIGRVHPDLEPYRQNYDNFLNVVQPEFLHLEETVWSDEHRYAGSFDALAIIEGETIWLDNKTTRSGIHAEVGLQLAAYRNAKHILRPDGTRTPNVKGDGAAVFHVRPEGWSLTPVRADDEVFEMFLNIRKVFEYDKTMSGTIIGQPVASGTLEGATPAPAPKRRAPRARTTAVAK